MGVKAPVHAVEQVQIFWKFVFVVQLIPHLMHTSLDALPPLDAYKIREPTWFLLKNNEIEKGVCIFTLCIPTSRQPNVLFCQISISLVNTDGTDTEMLTRNMQRV